MHMVKNKKKYSIVKKFLTIAIILMVFITFGCSASYMVKVNGYIDPTRPIRIEQGSNFHIIEDANSKNPLLEKEVMGKLDNMLKLKGYNTTDFEKAIIYLLYGYGIGHERTITSTMPVYTPGHTATITKTGPKGTSYSTVNIPGTTTYVPYTATVTDKWLSLKLIDGEDYRKEGKSTVLWIGEATITGENNDIRNLMNYLIAGIYKYFGEDTGKTLSISIKEDDPVVKSIMQYQR
ncbi:MAG TPA: hypothetical protein PLW88_00160 [Syntrophorhabdaceae bacterium]|nr:hypothetical protein [Syntrophorhabdaceae bacterium]HPP05752.1 hypothetical protein [Syntrophorhabdaceae bacterium]